MAPDPATISVLLATFFKKCFYCVLLGSGFISSLISWWGSGRPHTFLGWALPNAITNGIFGTTFALLLSYLKPDIPIGLLFFISASAGSLGRYTVVKILVKFFGIHDKQINK